MTSLPGWIPWTSPAALTTDDDPETDDLCEGNAVVPRGFDAADFSHRCKRPFGLDHQADELDDASLFSSTPVRFGAT